MPVKLFENYTEVLSEYERAVILPAVCRILRGHVGAKNAIRNKAICAEVEAMGYERVGEPRMRKIINRIRCADGVLVPFLVANSKGYYIATTREEVELYAASLFDRASAIFEVRACLLDQLTGKLFL